MNGRQQVEALAQKLTDVQKQVSDAFATFAVTTDEVGRATYLVNDQDVSDQVGQAAILIRHGQIPTLQLELRAGGSIEGRGIVKVILDDAQAEVPLGQAVLRFLESVDPIELEQQIIQGGMGDGIATACLRALRGMALS